MIHVVAVNESTVLADSTVDAYCKALTSQATNHIAKAWGTSTVHVERIAKGAAVPAGAWLLIFADHSDQEGALGYHDDQTDGLPVMYVFAVDCQSDGVSPSACASHELAESLIDPLLARAEIGNGRAWACEVGDPAQPFTYIVDGVEVQDFVYPDWFSYSPPAGAKYSHTGKITKPFEVPSGGYAQYSTDLKSWHSIGAELGAGHTRPARKREQLSG